MNLINRIKADFQREKIIINRFILPDHGLADQERLGTDHAVSVSSETIPDCLSGEYRKFSKVLI